MFTATHRQVLPVLLKDGYKVGHPFQYPDDLERAYANFTARGTRIAGATFTIPFGGQYFVEEYLIRQFRDYFFEQSRQEVMRHYQRRINNYLGAGMIPNFKHIEALHEVGYLPLHLKAVPEATLLPLRVPQLTVRNTIKGFGWLTNMPETLLSNILWMPTTSATTAFGYRRTFEEFAEKTGGDRAMVKWQGHDFSFRGLPGVEAAMLSGAAHLLSFNGTDTIPAIDFLEEYYGANSDTELVGGSVYALEHSVVQIGGEANEFETLRDAIRRVPSKAIISIICDTWNYWRVITEYLPRLKPEIMGREGKVVVRPDSGDPVRIICGDVDADPRTPQGKGTVRVLWEIFGGQRNVFGYKELDPHIGIIYGDSITKARQEVILEMLERKGFVSTIPVLGIGSFTYQHVTRDTYGQAMKTTYCQTTSRGGFAVSKNPITDDGTKKSACGLLSVIEAPDAPHGLRLQENCEWAQEAEGILQTTFLDGRAYNLQTYRQLCDRIDVHLGVAA